MKLLLPYALTFSASIVSSCLSLICAPVFAEAEIAQVVQSDQDVFSDVHDFIWFDQQGPKPLTLDMLALAQDLGFWQSKGLSPNTASVQISRELDDGYSQLFIEMLKTIRPEQDIDEPIGVEQLRQAAQAHHLHNLLDSMLPEHRQVQLLREQIRRYQQLEKYVWPTISSTNYRLGQRSPEIAKLRWMLTQFGDLPAKPSNTYREAIYDPGIVSAIKHFQLRHGLPESGELDSLTRKALQIPPSQKIVHLRKALLRWFALPIQLPERYLWVNIPAYQLQVMENNNSVLSMRVIVGKPETPTPQMATTLNLVTLNPTWTPPSSIIYGELLPKNGRNPGYLAAHGFELRKVTQGNSLAVPLANQSSKQIATQLSEFQLVQQPGADNALGRYRFSILNNEAIYLHDTPVKSLFRRPNRALSHGCVRLEKADILVNYLLTRHINQSPAAIKDALAQKSPRYLKLTEPLPVLMTYLTAWVDARGVVQFRPDIYKLDYP
ncbi:L,D-transpeptidase family protein [Shewanella alkalitolerans]|uniref:L,D-transpeptidase family protein n=1 Tax=Shewanella alkalitolerans TaxID=2864209 RepID=UPI001C6607B7|nr:L,D-transpeptidase family protein [Shewanella alkalitolerans]QYJ96295.1 L,D-transpeptidase family protein [Shewanella alkalitolerans]